MLSLLLLTATVGAGVLAGFFFAFSNTVMAGLGQAAAPAGIAGMQGINVVVQNPLFFVFFFGVPLLSGLLVVWAVFNLGQPVAIAIVLGALLVIVGMFGVTVAINVPMNQTLATLDPASAAAADYWATYLDRWTAWNHVRTVSCMLAAALFAFAYRGLA